MSKSTKNPYEVQKLPMGVHHDIVVVHSVITASGRQGRIFFKTNEGKVFSDREVNLLADHRSNDNECRAFVNLSGLTMSDLRLHMKRYNEQDKDRQKKQGISYAARLAAKYGYKLTKVKAKKVTP
jgi:hypothetical protein